LIEILIAMFIFLVGGLGVLSLFPVAMNNAGRVLGETRANILAQSVVAQITADCRVNYELPTATGYVGTASPTTGSAVAGANSNNMALARLTGEQPAPPGSPGRAGYFVTLLDGPGRGQSRFITGDAGGTSALAITPAWTSVVVVANNGNPVGPWTAPGCLPSNFPVEHYSITRMGLPERPLIAGEQIVQGWQGSPGPYYCGTPVNNVATWPVTSNSNYNYGTFGLNRDLAVRSFSNAPADGFYAGIANPVHVLNNAMQVDPFLAYNGTAGASAANTLVTTTQAWPTSPQLSTYYQVRIISGTGAGQVRTIIGVSPADASNHTLLISPNWTVPPDITSQYEIGWASTITVPPTPAWCAQLYPTTSRTATGTYTSNTVFATSGISANYQGKYLYIFSGANAGQAYAIVSNTPNTNSLTVTPAFTATGGSSSYVITESRGYVLITSGRATNRLFPIAWDQVDLTGQSNGHLIVCAGANFQSLSGITAAGPLGTNAPYQYNLQNATTFTIIGNWQFLLGWPSTGTATMPLILNAVPDGSAINSTLWTSQPPNPPWPWGPSPWLTPNPPPWFNTMNMVNYVANGASSSPTRLALDQYNGTAIQGGTYTSEYSYGVVFSDSGTDPSLPVRVDVFVWRNFDTTKDFAQNQKPVGHMAGYIKRP
jgi:hypothetical protein